MFFKIHQLMFYILVSLSCCTRGILTTSQGHTRTDFITNCKESTQHGIHKICLDDESRPFEVFCDHKTLNNTQAGWTLILQRQNGNIDFAHRPWPDFKFGFGNMNNVHNDDNDDDDKNDFFIGLDKLNALTSFENYQLHIVMQDFENAVYESTYESFEVADETYHWSTGDMVNGARGIDVGFTKSNAFCTASSSVLCEHLVPGWQPNPGFKHPKALLHIFGVYPEHASDTRPGRMGLYLYATRELRPLRSIKMLIAPKEFSGRYPVYSKRERKYDQRLFKSSFKLNF